MNGGWKAGIKAGMKAGMRGGYERCNEEMERNPGQQGEVYM